MMKAPFQIRFTQPSTEITSTVNSCPADFKYRLSFANAVYTSCELGEFIIQSVAGTDYLLELWWFAAGTNGFIDVVAEEPKVVVALFLLGNIEGELSGYGSVYNYAKTFNLFYVPVGNHRINLMKEEYLLLYFVPPANSFEGITLEHPVIRELIKRQQQQHDSGILLNGCPLPKHAWTKLKRMEDVAQHAVELDLPLRQYMIELLHLYSKEIRKHARPLPVYSSSGEKAVAVRTYILANLLSSELEGSEQLAKRFFISSKTLTREFKRLTGMTMRQYVIEQRLAYAKKLLADAHLPLIDIVIASGFTDTSHFIKKFKNKYGYTPKQHKKTERNRS